MKERAKTIKSYTHIFLQAPDRELLQKIQANWQEHSLREFGVPFEISYAQIVSKAIKQFAKNLTEEGKWNLASENP